MQETLPSKEKLHVRTFNDNYSVVWRGLHFLKSLCSTVPFLDIMSCSCLHGSPQVIALAITFVGLRTGFTNHCQLRQELQKSCNQVKVLENSHSAVFHLIGPLRL